MTTEDEWRSWREWGERFGWELEYVYDSGVALFRTWADGQSWAVRIPPKARADIDAQIERLGPYG